MTADDEDATARTVHKRNFLAGLWAAELLGLMGEAAQDYARRIMHPGHDPDEIHEDDHEWVVARLAQDLKELVPLSAIRARMAHFLDEARRQLGRDKDH